MTGALLLLAAAGLSTVTLDPSVELGPVKPMNCVNNGPLAPDKSINKSNFHWHRLLRIPYARTHDANICRRFGAPHVVDVSAVFPDPSADENGFTGTESILNEWNYVKGWSRDWEYASEVMSGRRIVRAFAYVTDENRAFTEVPLLVDNDGAAEVILAPNAFAYMTVEMEEK